jgi:hypothetical protein
MPSERVEEIEIFLTNYSKLYKEGKNDFQF